MAEGILLWTPAQWKRLDLLLFLMVLQNYSQVSILSLLHLCLQKAPVALERHSNASDLGNV